MITKFSVLYAVADIVTGGRIIFGVGRGYHTREVETFGAPMLDNQANQALFEEQMELLLKAFSEESFSHHGRHYRIPPPVDYRDQILHWTEGMPPKEFEEQLGWFARDVMPAWGGLG